LSSVDLPEPEVPTMAQNSPRLMLKLTPFNARTLFSPMRYTLYKSFTTMTGLVFSFPFSTPDISAPCICECLRRCWDTQKSVVDIYTETANCVIRINTVHTISIEIIAHIIQSCNLNKEKIRRIYNKQWKKHIKLILILTIV